MTAKDVPRIIMTTLAPCLSDGIILKTSNFGDVCMKCQWLMV
jgi:hypothetical protein